MTSFFKVAALSLAALALSVQTASACRGLNRMVGWTIIYAGNVTGYVDRNGKRSDDFEGCDYDRILIIDYNKSVRCTSYGYSYAYNPDVVIFQRGPLAKACIERELYDISLN